MDLFDVQTVAEARRDAENLLTDQCEVFVLGEPVTDKVTGKVTRPETSVYVGPCRLRLRSMASAKSDVAMRNVITQRMVLEVPAETEGIDLNQRVRLTNSLVQANLVGMVFRVAEDAFQSHLVLQRWILERN